MGTWGVNNFDNDIAIEWINLLIEENDKELIIIALKEIDNEPDYIEAPECIEALCAIEIMAAFKTHDYQGLPKELITWIEEERQTQPELNLTDLEAPEFTEDQYELAIRVLQRIVSDSELCELWEESDYFQEWVAVQQRLLSDLS